MYLFLLFDKGETFQKHLRHSDASITGFIICRFLKYESTYIYRSEPLYLNNNCSYIEFTMLYGYKYA